MPKLLEAALLYRIATAKQDIDTKSNKAVVFDGKQVTSKQNRSNPQPGSPCHTLAVGSCDSALCVKVCTHNPQSNGIIGSMKTMYGLCSNNSNSMKSPNPGSGIYEAATTRTLDTQGGNPSCCQGGMIIVETDAEHGKRYMVVLNDQGGESMSIEKSNVSPTLRSETHGHLPIIAKETKAVHESISGDRIYISDIAYALRSGRKPMLIEEVNLHPDIAPTLTASAGGTSRPGGGQGSELDYYIAYTLAGNMIGRADHNGPQGNGINVNNCFTLNATDCHAVAFFNFHSTDTRASHGDKASCQTVRQYKGATDLVVKLASGRKVTGTITANCGEKRFLGNQEAFSGNYHVVGIDENIPHYIVRRLTPTECERLQGFPDDWTKYGADNGKEIADTPRYAMLGNSIAVPCVRFILKNIVSAESKHNFCV